MFEKLDSVMRRFDEIDVEMAQPDVDGKTLTKLSKERASIEELVAVYREYKGFIESRAEAKELLDSGDQDLKKLARDELDDLEPKILDYEKKLQVLTLPKDPNDDKNVLLEIRAGTGGEEASLFAADLLRMYTRFADKLKWRVENLSMTESSTGGLKEVIVLISGDRVYSRLKFERGVHRVQRVPVTESQGRVHTSACTVAVLPEAEDVEIEINPSDLDITVCRASGAGGQHVNTTDSAVRIVHKPTGLAVECQDERSQLKNKERALKILKARLFEKAQADQQASISADRKSQVGSGDRSERIRTYNFPQGRMTDHRINLTLYRLEEIMGGDLSEVVDSLGSSHQAELLKQMSDQS